MVVFVLLKWDEMHKIYQYNKTDEWKDKIILSPGHGAYLKTTKSIKDHNNGLIEAPDGDLFDWWDIIVTSTGSLM